jgi:hypothetical protein
MPKRNFRPPKNVIKQWPEVFEDIYVSTVPIEYIHSLEVEFLDGRIWEINIKDQLALNDPIFVIEKTIEVLREFQDEVYKINFKVDVKRLKKDIIKSTKNILNTK